MEEIEADVVVIGSGPAGQKAAIQAAKLGKKVVVIEQELDPGGNCLYNGTIPSKSLREAIIDLTGYYERNFHGIQYDRKKINISELINNRLGQTINAQRNMIWRQFKKNGIQVVLGSARFENPHRIVVENVSEGITYQIHGEAFVIATGSKPRNPTNIPFDDDVILDSTRLLRITKVPKTMIVLGGGIIGAEYASFFSALGTEVTVVDKKERLLPLLDAEIGVLMQTALTDLGLNFLGNKEPEEVLRKNDRAFVRFKDGTSAEADVLLFALGRQANVEGLHIENAGVKMNNRGYVVVNALFQTSVPHIYAAGDVIGGPSLASTSMEQGRLASRHAIGIQTHHFPNIYPIGIYTIPEISSIGMTEEELKELGYRYEVGRAYYYELARSHIAGSNTGMFKILFHAETLEILGIHIIGRGATEVIHIGQVAKSFNAKIDYFIDQVFNYPTYAEGYRVAALNGINKIKSRR